MGLGGTRLPDRAGVLIRHLQGSESPRLGEVEGGRLTPDLWSLWRDKHHEEPVSITCGKMGKLAKGSLWEVLGR